MESIITMVDVGLSRIRSTLLKMRRASVDKKVAVGPRCRFIKPGAMALGFRVTLEQGVYLKCVAPTARLAIGAWSFLGNGVEIDCQANITIGSHVLISPGCFITDHNHGTLADKRIDQQSCIAADIVIGDDVWLGTRSVILPGVTIGEGAVIAAGAVVNRDVHRYTVVAGIPARRIGQRDGKK